MVGVRGCMSWLGYGLGSGSLQTVEGVLVPGWYFPLSEVLGFMLVGLGVD